MAAPKYPASSALMVTFLDNVRRSRINSISGVNPTLINVDGEQMYVYIKNLSPAQLSNDNPDIWRIQLPKRQEFESIKESEKIFILLGYDYIRRVYTTWNPYWCKQRLNVAESCSMYSRLSLQVRVARTQKIEKLQLQNEGEVICIPSTLIANFVKKIRDYYPEESVYVPVGSSIQKRKEEEEQLSQEETNNSRTHSLFSKLIDCYDTDDFREFLSRNRFQRSTLTNYINRVIFIFEEGFLLKHKDLFIDCYNFEEIKQAINRFCMLPDILPFEKIWNGAIHAALMQYVLYVEERTPGTHIKGHPKEEKREQIKERTLLSQDSPKRKPSSTSRRQRTTPSFELDEFGKLKCLDNNVIELLLPMVKDVDYPDWEEVIKEVKAYYPAEATEKMNPADWMKLFDATKWRRKRGRKTNTSEQIESDSKRSQLIYEQVEDDVIDTVNEEIPVFATPSHQIDTKLLLKVFDNRVTSYKYLWFWSIITIAKEKGQLSISFKDLVIRMARFAWPSIFCDELEFGPFDMMRIYLTDVMKKTKLIKNASEKVVESCIKQQYDYQGLAQLLSPLLKNVPYRFLSPWIKFTTVEDVVAKSQTTDYTGLYVLQKDSIVLKEEWWHYIENNYERITDFIITSFIDYLKQYNYPLSLLNFKIKYKSR